MGARPDPFQLPVQVVFPEAQGAVTLLAGRDRLCLWSAVALGVSLNEAGAVAEPIAARARQGLLSLFALLRGVAGKGLCT